MANWNGLVASLAKASLTGVSSVGVNQAFPSKFFENGQFAALLTGVSGVIAINVIGSVGGATFTVAGRTNISAAGSFPIPLLIYGFSGNPVNQGIPRPYSVDFASASALGNSFTASVFFAGAYN
jgi:hypothetical protein